jgi:hypothetical protein
VIRDLHAVFALLLGTTERSALLGIEERTVRVVTFCHYVSLVDRTLVSHHPLDVFRVEKYEVLRR